MSAKAYFPAVFGLALTIYLFVQVPVEAQNFPKECLSKDHFIVYHENRSLANKAAWRAEYHYKKILRHMGVADFHPWEKGEKCVILIFGSQDEYVKETGAPEWSGGLAFKDKDIIATFEGSIGLEDRILPHELTHLVLKEYFGKSDIPLWLTEGMAQYEEESTLGYGYKKNTMKAARGNKSLRLKDIFEAKYLPEDGEECALFYAQSASIIDYMRAQLLQTQFSVFLKEIKNGVAMDEALKRSYQWKFPKGVEDFERRWLEYVTTKY